MIGECQEVCVRERIGEVHKCLRKLETRGKPAVRSTNVTVNKFKVHFESVEI